MSRENQTPRHTEAGPDAVPRDKSGPDAITSGGPDAQRADTRHSHTPATDVPTQEADSRAAGEHAEADKSGESKNTGTARVKQSNAPVDVPRTPAKPTAQTEDVAAEESKPPKNPDDGTVWSDTELPAPNKKGVRTSWF